MLTKLRLLVLEDTETDAELLLMRLQRKFDVTYSRVYREADFRRVLAEDRWDLVVSDWSMPDLTGLAAYRLMRELGYDLPFIIMSGSVEDVAAGALEAGVLAFLSKDRPAELVPIIERVLREKAQPVS